MEQISEPVNLRGRDFFSIRKLILALITKKTQKPTLKHTTISIVCYGIDVRRYFVTLLASVHVHDFFSINRQAFVWINNHTEEA